MLVTRCLRSCSASLIHRRRGLIPFVRRPPIRSTRSFPNRSFRTRFFIHSSRTRPSRPGRRGEGSPIATSVRRRRDSNATSNSRKKGETAIRPVPACDRSPPFTGASSSDYPPTASLLIRILRRLPRNCTMRAAVGSRAPRGRRSGGPNEGRR